MAKGARRWIDLGVGSLQPPEFARLALALVLDAVAQATGFAFGAGRSAVKAGLYDLDREPHLDAADRARFLA